MSELEKLKNSLHPSDPMNVIEQCRIVWEALQPNGAYARNLKGLANYLGVSENKAYKMSVVHRDLIPEAKEFFKGTGYQVNTAYQMAAKEKDEQRKELVTSFLSPISAGGTNASNP